MLQVFVCTDVGGAALNLQNVAVLINLDFPWNPAILDHLIARARSSMRWAKQQDHAYTCTAPRRRG